MFSCTWGLSIHMDACGQLIPVARKAMFEFTLQICCETGIRPTFSRLLELSSYMKNNSVFE